MRDGLSLDRGWGFIPFCLDSVQNGLTKPEIKKTQRKLQAGRRKQNRTATRASGKRYRPYRMRLLRPRFLPGLQAETRSRVRDSANDSNCKETTPAPDTQHRTTVVAGGRVIKEPASRGFCIARPGHLSAPRLVDNKTPLPTQRSRGSGRDVSDADRVPNKTHRTLKGFIRWHMQSSKG